MKLVQSTEPYQAQFLEILLNALDRRQFVDVTTDTADTEYEIEHGLGFIPVGYLVILQDKPAETYLSTTARTMEKIFLKCNVASVTMRVMVF